MNKPFRKIITLILVLFILMFAFSGCKNGPNSEQKIDEIVYSNIASKSVQQELLKMMKNANISQQRQDVLLKKINQFNTVIGSEMLVEDYKEYISGESKYDPYDMQDKWAEKSPDFMGYNCRITAFSVFRDFLEISLKSKVNDEMIVFDLVSLEEDNSAMVEKDDEKAFSIFYSTVPTDFTKDTNVHIKKFQENFKNKGIKFLENENASIISVVFHESIDKNENYLFIGHTGVLFDYKNKVYFLEKIAFQEPYQLTKFNNRGELFDYLMSKYNVEFDQPTAQPFIMENDKPLTNSYS